MSQCVPSWDLEDKLRDHPQTSHSLPHDVPTLDYEVAELRWENGQPSILGLPRAASKYPASAAAMWDNPPHSSATGDTLESVVNQATARRLKPSAASELVPWYDHQHQQEAAVDVPTMKSTPHTRAFSDALVPCGSKNKKNGIKESTTHVPAGISTCMVSSCSVARTRGNLDLSDGGGGGKFGGGRDHRCRHSEAVEGSEYVGGGGGFTSELSPENTSSGGREYTRSRTSGDDSVCHSMSQRETGDEEIVKKRSTGTLGKSSVSTKRSRAAAIHNQSERRRRDKINQRMKTLQKLVPNSSKTDKASMLDEVIEYLKQLQAQVYLMSRTTTPPMMLPPFMQQQLPQMPNMNMTTMMPPPLGMGMGLGLGSVMDFNAMTRATAAAAGAGHAIQPNATFMPSAIGSWDNSGAGDRLAALASTHDALSAFLACQMQPMTMDTYSRLAALYQQFQQQPPPCGSKD